jgi:hypothetical protein
VLPDEQSDLFKFCTVTEIETNMRDEYTMEDKNALFKELIQAIQGCDENTVATLIERGVDIEQDGNSALKMACKLGYASIVQCLIGADANIHQNNNEALWLAVTHRHAAVTAVLMAERADYNDREGAIWEEATKPFSTEDEFSALIKLGIESLNHMEWAQELCNAFSQNNQLLANVLAQALPKNIYADAALVALEYGNLAMVKQFLDNGADFKQDDEQSAWAYYFSWEKGGKSLMPQLYACGATTSGALVSHIFGSNVYSELGAEFLEEMLKISQYEKETCENVVSIAITNNFLGIASVAISYLAEFPDALESIFDAALSHDAEELYTQLMSLKAGIPFGDDRSWLDCFISNCTDHTLISYLLAQVGPSLLLEEGKLLDKALEEKDWPWVKHLVCLGLRPSPSTDFNVEIAALIDNIKHDKPYQFAVYLQAAEKGGIWAAVQVADRYMKGDGIEQNKQLAAYWYTKAAESGYIGSMLNLAKMLAVGDGIEQDKPAAIYWFRMLTNDANCARSAEMQEMYDEDVLSRIGTL